MVRETPPLECAEFSDGKPWQTEVHQSGCWFSTVANDALRGSLQMEHFLAITGKQHRAGWVLISVAKTSISHYHKQKHKRSPMSTRLKI